MAALADGGGLHDVVEGVAFDVLHDEVVEAVGGAGDVDGLDNVVVGESRGGFSFFIKAFNELGVVAHFCGEDFYGDDAIEGELAGFVDGGHGAFTEGAEDVVAGELAVFAFLDLATDALGLVDGDEAVFDEEISEAALVGVGGLLLLLAAEVDFGFGDQAHVDDDFADLGVEVGGESELAVGVGHDEISIPGESISELAAEMTV